MADFQNPQQEPGMERRLLLAFAVTFLIVVITQPLMKKYGPQPPAETPKAAATQPAAPAAPVSLPPPPAVPVPAGAKQASSEAETVVENDFYRIRFSNRGGLVKSWVLKQFTDDKEQPLELVNATAVEKFGYPLSLFTYDQGLQQRINSALYVPSNTGTQTAPADLAFEYSDQDVAVRKTFHFDRTYVIKVETSVRYRGSDVQAFPAWPAGFGDENIASSYAAGQIEYQHNDKIERLAIKKVSGGNTLAGPFHWAGATDRYFAAVFIPDDPANASLVTFRNTLQVPKDPNKPNETIPVETLGIASGDKRGPSSQRLYVGPKKLEVVETIPIPGIQGSENSLTGLVNFGFFGIIAKPLFLWLKWTYQHIVPNWGWAIVLQTIIINLALLPLRLSQMKTALKMQKLQPQIKALQEKYKKYSMRDPKKQEMNQEMAALYKQEGVNPAGGCLPILIQMPFLFAYYSMLSAVIDLRHAHWAWVRDLSSPDPHFILPIAIVVTMFLVQRMTPQAGLDPAQQKMMNITMPVFLGFVSWNLAAGLCLYWSMGNIISIVQQSIMNRTSMGREMREIAEKRARRNQK